MTGGPGSQSSVLDAVDLKKDYVGGDGTPIHVLTGVQLAVQPGEFVAIIGASGSGKSTLLHLLGALDHPTGGTVRLGGQRYADLTPAALGPFVVPAVNIEQHAATGNVNMVTCGGQATVPIVAAASQVAQVPYAEIVSSIASRSAGPGTRANIDEFTHTTARAIEVVGGAGRGKAIIVLNPAEPPLVMRNTVFMLVRDCEEDALRRSIESMVAAVREYVPGYRLKQDIQMERCSAGDAVDIPGYGRFDGIKCSVFLEVTGAAHYLPAYAGNLDVMTSAALATAERIAALRFNTARVQHGH